MQNDVKFHGLSEYVVTFHKICSFDNNIFKIHRNVYFVQEYTVATKIIRPPVLKIFFDLYLLDEESYRALVFFVL